jgi:sugar lactone lactonase YvrE
MTVWLIVVAVVVVLIIVFTGNRGGRDATTAEIFNGFELMDAGFSTPESILYDKENDVYLVSNINGAPAEMDDNGFISIVTPQGEVAELKWIDGEDEEVQLSAPKGMAIVGDKLFVSDIFQVAVFDRSSGEQLGVFNPEGVTFLNDIVPDGEGGVYFTDSGLNPDFSSSGTDAIWYIGPDSEPTVVLQATDLGGPNGITMSDDGLIVVSFGGTSVLEVDPVTSELEKVTDMPAGSLDGVEWANDGRLLVSSWQGSAVYAVSVDGSAETIVENVESPADIGYDSERDLVLIPLFNSDGMIAVPVTH